MIDWVQVVFLALVQGLSEFLPVSSSAHLVLPALLFGWNDQGLMFDVAVHTGTLVAVILYFWRDLIALLGDLYPPARRFGGHRGDLPRLIVATVPAVLAGLVFSDLIENQFRGLEVIAGTTILFGLLLGVAAIYSKRRRQIEQVAKVTWQDALIIGCAQMLALVPGVSRSGVTITAGLLLGYSPTTAARFSFLMSVPIILGAMLFMGLSVIETGTGHVSLSQLVVAMLVAAVSAYSTIALFLGLLNRIGLLPFVWYRLLLGLVLVFIIVMQEV